MAGPATVSGDGKLICTNPGAGVRAPGWHAPAPRPYTPPPPPPPTCEQPGNLVNASEILDGVCPGIPIPEPECDAAKFDRCEDLTQKRRDKCENDYAQQAINGFRRCRNTSNVALCTASVDLLYQDARRQCLWDLNGGLDWCRNEYNCAVSGAQAASVTGPFELLDLGSNTNTDPITKQLDQLAQQMDELMAPHRGADPIPPAALSQLDDLLNQADAVAGGDAVAYLAQQVQSAEEAFVEPLGVIGEQPGDVPPYPVLYAALIQRPDSFFYIRGETEPGGQYSFFIPVDATLTYMSFYDPQTNRWGLVHPYRRANPQYRLPHFYLRPMDDSFRDRDGDQLADVVEIIYGTDLDNPDTDGDGLRDGAEVAVGADPLSGLARLGVIGSVAIIPAAQDICVVDNVAALPIATQRTLLIDVRDGTQPKILTEVENGGGPRAIACAPGWVAAATGQHGLDLIDIRDPATASVVHQLPVDGVTQAVAIGHGVAYVGSDTGKVLAVDLATGAVRAELDFDAPIHDLAVGAGAAADYLYVLAFKEQPILRELHGGWLHAVDQQTMTVTGSTFVPGTANSFYGRMHLFVEEARAYISQQLGYSTFDLSDPRNPQAFDVNQPQQQQQGWRDIVSNGSGLGVAAVGPIVRPDGTTEYAIYLQDIRDPAITDAFVRLFRFPGGIFDVALHNGLAHVAGAGLQILNYERYDTGTQPPTMTLTTNFAPGKAEAGNRLYLAANASDDVQVRDVAFFVDGRQIAVDGSHPFARWVTVPSDAKNVSIYAQAQDTGGNISTSEVMTLSVVADATPLRVIDVTPWGGAQNPTTVRVFLSEPPDAATVTNQALQLYGAGPDGALGTADDVAVTGGTVAFDAATTAVELRFAAPLPAGLYRAQISTTLRDRAGNALSEPYAWRFRAGPADRYWTGAADGLWGLPFNWSGGELPRADEDVLIDVPGTITVTINATDYAVGTLRSAETVVLDSSGLLTATEIIQDDGAFVLHGGTLVGATIHAGADGTRFRPDNFGGTLDGVTIDGRLALTGTNGARVNIRNGFTLLDDVYVGEGALFGSLSFEGVQTLDGGTADPRQFIFSESQNNSFWVAPTAAGAQLTIAPNMTLRGHSATFGGNLSTYRVINRGQILADGGSSGGGVFRLTNGIWENQGTLAAGNGGQIQLQTLTITNTGQLRPGRSTFAIGGDARNFAQGASGTLTVEIGGTNVGTEYTQLIASQRATLGGTLEVLLVDGFVPNIGDRFEVMTFGERVGQFATVNGLEIGGGKRLRIIYGETSVVLEVVAG